VLDFDGEAAKEYGRLRAHLRRAGTPVGIHDMLMGAHALSEVLRS
jgi:tRNA(fMet)-specific endonuclease VapC